MVFVGSIDEPVVTDSDEHHLAKVLRLRLGEPMVVCDGRGAWRSAEFGRFDGSLGEIRRADPPSVRLRIGFALIKGDRPELVVQKLTELGIDSIMPFSSDHGVVRMDRARIDKHHARLTRVAREAAMQCRRTVLPTVTASEPLADLVEGADDLSSWYLADIAAPPLADSLALPIAGDVTVLIGPEGGWSAAERSLGITPVGLPGHVLRAETASIAAATLLAARRSV